MSNDVAVPSAPLGGSAGHTPGPWHYHLGRIWSECCDDGIIVASVGGDHGRIDLGTLRANAALISAAPELLSTLKRIIVATEEGRDSRGVIELARKVVLRAENG